MTETKITENEIIEDIVGAWQSWTPTWTNLTVGNGIVDAKYIQIGKTVHFRLSFILGSTSSVGTGPYFTLPVSAISGAYSSTSSLGGGGFTDQGSSFYRAICMYNNSTTASVNALLANETYVKKYRISATDPFTWTTDDIIHMNGIYEAA